MDKKNKKNKKNKMIVHSEFIFDGARHLEHYDGKCANLHGHTWKVEIEIEVEKSIAMIAIAQNNGILWDFTNIKPIQELLDHKYLNDFLEFNPTAENLSEFLIEEIKKTINIKEYTLKVKLYETSIGKTTFIVNETHIQGEDNVEQK